jgi:hypothetical protein
MFTPEMSDADSDVWLQDPARIGWKWLRIDEPSRKMLRQLARRLEPIVQRPVQADPLDSARALVAWAFSLPAWTRKTTYISEPAKAVRAVLLRASDPMKTIFEDLPAALRTKSGSTTVDVIVKVAQELDSAYADALKRIGDQLMISLGHSGSSSRLRSRAKPLLGKMGDFRLDAFVSRLAEYDGGSSQVESLASLATNRAAREFTDQDFERAAMQLADWAFQFRRAELLASIQGRPSGRHALAVAFGGRTTFSTTIDIAEEDRGVISKVRDDLLSSLRDGRVSKELYLAALAEAGALVLEESAEMEVDRG